MILIAFRNGLRAGELCDLQWHQVEPTAGRLHVRRSKTGTPSVHPMRDEIRALRRLQREQPPGPHVFTAERGGPYAVFDPPPICYGTPADSPWQTGHARSRRGSVIAIFSIIAIQIAIQSWFKDFRRE